MEGTVRNHRPSDLKSNVLTTMYTTVSPQHYNGYTKGRFFPWEYWVLQEVKGEK